MNDDYYDNCFLLLGSSGVGKSTLVKILSEDSSIIISDSFESQTKEIKCYKCQKDDFKYIVIDTPGSVFDDSKDNGHNFKDIKKVLTSDKYKIKGIVLLYNFQETRFGYNLIKGLQKIVELVPWDNFWDYIIIIFSFYYLDDDDDDELKERKIKRFKEEFIPLISASKVQNIKSIEFSKIKKEFVN